MKRFRFWIAAGVFLAAVAAGFAWARPAAPTPLRAELEQRLSALLGGTVRIPELRISLGWGLELEGLGVVAWPDGEQWQLRADRVVAKLRLLSPLTGQNLLRELRLEGPALWVRRGPDGRWSPPAAELLLSRGPSDADRAKGPLAVAAGALEGFARGLLEHTLVADSVVVVSGRLEVDDSLGARGKPRQVVAEAVQGRVTRRALLGDKRLRLSARLRDGRGERGSFEWQGRIAADGSLRFALALTDVALDTVSPLVLAESGAELDGRVSGTLAFTMPEAGGHQLEVDLVGRDLASSPPRGAGWEGGALESRTASLLGRFELEPEVLRVAGLRWQSDALALELDGSLGRPLADRSRAELALALRDVSVAQVRHLLSWLPKVRREEAQALLAPLQAGELELLRTGGTASVAEWQDFLAGRTPDLPADFIIDARLRETSLLVGDDDRVSGLSGRLWWSGDRLVLRALRATLNERPLPELNVEVEGVRHLLASDPEARRIAPGAVPLSGLRPLWQSLRGEPDEPSQMASIRLQLERLDHPMFLWPIQGAEARLQPLEHGIFIETRGGTWAGVPMHGEAQWQFEPEERVDATLVASAPRPAPRPELPDDVWVRGVIEVGPMRGKRWQHESARGEFDARSGALRFPDLALVLSPEGRATASGNLDLSHEDSVPFHLNLSVVGGRLEALDPAIGLPADAARGQVDVEASLRGALVPDRPLTEQLEGRLEIRARDGVLRKAVPAMVAVALASEVFNPFAKREEVRFHRLATDLVIEDGTLRTDGLTLDGPDVRAFASGSVRLADPQAPIDAEIALFLFRPVDSLIDRIPIVNVLMLGEDRNLLAAHLTLTGPWETPEARLVPTRSLVTGPVIEGVPSLVRRGMRALDALLPGSDRPPPKPTPPARLDS